MKYNAKPRAILYQIIYLQIYFITCSNFIKFEVSLAQKYA